jgi:CelD/BcsL family acetyltransferase involved in cellulose biosynthesis
MALRQLAQGISNPRRLSRASTGPYIHTVPVSHSGGIEVTVLRGDSSVVAAIATEWEDLCMEGPSNAPFFTPTWIRAWLESFAPSAKVVLVTARRNGRLRGVLPLIEHRIGYRGMHVTRLSAPFNYYSGRADFVHGADDGADVATAIWDNLDRDVRWSVLEYRDVIEESGFARIAAAAARSGNAVIKRETIRSPYLAFDPADDLSQCGPAKRMRRAQRALARNGGYTVRRTAPADLSSLARLVRQEDAGWKGKAGTAIAREPAALEFYSAIVSSHSRSFTAVINEIVVGNEPIAINLGIEMGDRYFDPKRTYDESQHRYGPGHLITHEILLGLPARGIVEFDMMGHDESYKLAWSTTSRQHYHYLIFRRGLMGRALSTCMNLAIPYVKKARSQLARARHFRSSLNRQSTRQRSNPES